MKKNSRIFRIGVDLDTKKESVVEKVKDNCRKQGKISRQQETKNGFHFMITLPEPCDFITSLEKRFICGDDMTRIIFDLIRWNHNHQNIDVLFDLKRPVELSKLGL